MVCVVSVYMATAHVFSTISKIICLQGNLNSLTLSFWLTCQIFYTYFSLLNKIWELHQRFPAVPFTHKINCSFMIWLSLSWLRQQTSGVSFPSRKNDITTSAHWNQVKCGISTLEKTAPTCQKCFATRIDKGLFLSFTFPLYNCQIPSCWWEIVAVDTERGWLGCEP